jgi:hypothetical protein
MSIIRQADATWLGNSFKTRRDIDAVAEDIVLIDDDVADVNADAEFDSGILRYAAVLCGHVALDFHCATRGVYDAGEFHQQTVAGRFDDPSAMLRDLRVNQRFSENFELGQGAFFVSAHEAAVACQNSRQSPVDPIAAQWKAPRSQNFFRSIKPYWSTGPLGLWSERGQGQKYSLRADIFRLAPEGSCDVL